jgi:hypothetical protein
MSLNQHTGTPGTWLANDFNNASSYDDGERDCDVSETTCAPNGLLLEFRVSGMAVMALLFTIATTEVTLDLPWQR